MMMKTKTFEELEVWKKAHEYVLNVYKCSEEYPKSEVHGLTSQFRRAAFSIAANIAEGYKRLSKPEKLRFFNFSQASLEECRYCQILSRDLNYITIEKYSKLESLINDTSRLLNSYCDAIRTSITK